jgi:hypothetical protein
VRSFCIFIATYEKEVAPNSCRDSYIEKINVALRRQVFDDRKAENFSIETKKTTNTVLRGRRGRPKNIPGLRALPLVIARYGSRPERMV